MKIKRHLFYFLFTSKQSLGDTELRPNSEYYSVDEMKAKFKKRKRRVKTVRQQLTADDLLPLEDHQVESTLGSTSDLGNRASRLTKITNNESLVSTSYNADILEVEDSMGTI